MFAVIKTGGKQYRVSKDDVIAVEKLTGESGDVISFTDVLMLAGEGDPQLGAPLVDGVTVTGEVVEQTRGAKILVFKKKRRKNYRRTQGHRQHITLVRITDIFTGGEKPPATQKPRLLPRRFPQRSPAQQ
jgi:large subunit ribosomal protein L21